jgi:hypothetical protein
MLEYFILVHPLLASETEPSSWRPVPYSSGILMRKAAQLEALRSF